MIAPFTNEATLKRKIRQHLKELGFVKNKDGELCPPDTSKETYRHLHRIQRQEKLARCKPWLEDQISKLKKHFAAGAEIDPANISPKLEEISPKDKHLAYLFRLASLTWSIPVSNGYGRRMRFLVWDQRNGKLIGLIGLADPVFNMNARDRAIGWKAQDRSDRLVNVMDACVLGAIPPYNQLLCSKLVACLVRTKEVERAFKLKYGQTQGIISGIKKHARLACVTTTSALGRSSVYNRLKLGGIEYLQPVGFTAGWGHFQIPDSLFKDLRKFLKRKRHRYANGHQYGNGPNWRIRVVRAALDKLGINSEILKHNLEREVFVCSLADNAHDVLCGRDSKPTFENLKSVEEVSDAALDRWIIPRAENRPAFREWTVDQTLGLIAAPLAGGNALPYFSLRVKLPRKHSGFASFADRPPFPSNSRISQ
ncbi:MAG TPA: Druantia anti-phage system protein DruA [Verrucomicrobiae bacterium]|nr:Druantia anti-phage system protein DruA [Verrucomicrobiae bacterium]